MRGEFLVPDTEKRSLPQTTVGTLVDVVVVLHTITVVLPGDTIVTG